MPIWLMVVIIVVVNLFVIAIIMKIIASAIKHPKVWFGIANFIAILIILTKYGSKSFQEYILYAEIIAAIVGMIIYHVYKNKQRENNRKDEILGNALYNIRREAEKHGSGIYYYDKRTGELATSNTPEIYKQGIRVTK